MAMKIRTLRSVIISTAFLFFQKQVQAQVINWKNSFTENTHLLHANLGAEYGVTAGLGYHHVISATKFPLWVGGEVTLPAGNQPIDDFKLRLGTHIRIAVIKKIYFSVRIQGIVRRYHNQSVRLFNVGSDLAGVVGYYRQRWFLGLESGFDKAIVTNFKHSEWFRKNIYDRVQDGWYQPATGGNFYYGLLGSYSRRKVDFTFKAGRILQQDFKSQPVLPFYGQLGVNFRF